MTAVINNPGTTNINVTVPPATAPATTPAK